MMERKTQREPNEGTSDEDVLVCNFLMFAESRKSTPAFEQTHVMSESAKRCDYSFIFLSDSEVGGGPPLQFSTEYLRVRKSHNCLHGISR